MGWDDRPGVRRGAQTAGELLAGLLLAGLDDEAVAGVCDVQAVTVSRVARPNASTPAPPRPTRPPRGAMDMPPIMP